MLDWTKVSLTEVPNPAPKGGWERLSILTYLSLQIIAQSQAGLVHAVGIEYVLKEIQGLRRQQEKEMKQMKEKLAAISRALDL